MRRINFAFIGILIAVVTVLGTGMHFLHEKQIQGNASAWLDRARRAEESNDLEKAEQSLAQFLNIKREENIKREYGPTWEWYARVADKRDSDHRQRQRVYLLYEQALRHNPGDLKLERRCADIALELGRYRDAQGHLTKVMETKFPSGSQGQPAATGRAGLAELAELEDLLGQCEHGLNQLEQAQGKFGDAIKHDPRRVSCYDRMARLYRADLRKIDAADRMINEMVAQNSKAGLAHAYRWRYADEFLKSAAATDIQKAIKSAAATDIPEALKLAPDDPEVLLAAARASKQKGDGAAAREHLAKGFQLDPKNRALALGLAGLEKQEKHLDRAEDVLRRAFQANPTGELAFFLAETLILRDKIDGRDGAAHYIALLRNAPQGDAVVRFLEAEILFHGKKWVEAIGKIEKARAVLGSEPGLMIQLDLMLAKCYSETGDEEQRLDALRRAAERDQGPESESARSELASSLVQSGKRDQAVTILMPLEARKPEWRLDLVAFLLAKAIRQPRDQQNWLEVERQLSDAENALPQAGESIALLRFDFLAAQGRLRDAQSLLTSLQAKNPKNLRYRLARARLTQRQGRSTEALQILDQAEKDLVSSPENRLEIQLARLDYWGLEGGVAAKAAVAKLAETREQIPAAKRPAFLDRLGLAEIRLNELKLARQHWRELAALQPENLRVRLGLFELAIVAGDRDAATALVDEIRKVEGDEGTNWQFKRAALLIDRVRRGESEKLLEEARRVASKIAEEHPKLPDGFVLKGELAELAGSSDEAIGHYLRAVELGNIQPTRVRKLVGLLSERNRFDDIEHVSQVLRNQGAAVDDITIVKALDAIRKQDFDRGIALARQVFSDSSTNSSDHLVLGRIYKAARRAAEAGKEFRRAVELGPGVPESWLSYVQYLVQAKQVDQARAAVLAAQKTLPPNRATMTLAQCWLLLGDAKQAEGLIGKAMSAEGKSADPAVLRLAIMVALSQNRLDQVNGYLDKLGQVTDLSPEDRAWANRTHAALHLNKGQSADRDRALALVDENLRNDPNSIEDQGLRATILALRPAGRGEAVTILERLAGANRLGDNERFRLAQLYLRQQDEKKYQDEMLRLLNQKVKSPQHLAHFVNFWIGRNQLESADRWLAELKKAEPQGTRALELEARLLDLRKRKPELLALLEARSRDVPDQIGSVADLLNRYGFAKEAEEAYKAYVARDPRQPDRVLALATFLARKDRPAEAINILKTAWSTCPPDRVALAAVTIVDAPSADEAQKRQVETWLVEATRKRPASTELKTRLAIIWLWQGRYDEATDWLQKLLAQSPDSPEALNTLAWLVAMRDPGKAPEALEMINHAIELTGAVPSYIDTRAVVLIRAGRLDQAILDLDRARGAEPRNPNFALHQAWAYREKGDTEGARRALDQAKQLGWTIAKCDPLERSLLDRWGRGLIQ
jgi:tetratricopeptide (TPR) repeat protein